MKFLQESPKPVMKFREFVRKYDTIDNRSKKDWESVLNDLMNQHNLSPLGSGKYGSVYGNPVYPYVIKVFMKDTAYLRWLNFCISHPHNAYCPKVRGRVVKINQNFMAVRLEKLKVYSGSDSPDAILYDADEEGDHDASEVVNFLESNSKLLDLHDANFMLRPSDNHLVVVDPFYNWYRIHSGFTIDPDDVSDLKNLF